jgi:predicted kinase
MRGRAGTMTRDRVSPRGSVVMMCGLPASGKTMTAERLHGYTGGVLIRSCDVYKELGISLPDWVRRTAGLTRDVTAYEQVRDAAYARMQSLVKEHLTAGSRLVIVDAVHGESGKRTAVFDVCAAHKADPLLLWCRCEDRTEIERRLGMRRGREVSERELRSAQRKGAAPVHFRLSLAQYGDGLIPVFGLARVTDSW